MPSTSFCPLFEIRALSTSRPFLPSRLPPSVHLPAECLQERNRERNVRCPCVTLHRVIIHALSTTTRSTHIHGEPRARILKSSLCVLADHEDAIISKHTCSTVNILEYNFDGETGDRIYIAFITVERENACSGTRMLSRIRVARFLNRDPMPFLSNVGANFIYSEQPGDSKWNLRGYCVFRSRGKLYVSRMFMMVQKCVTRPSKHARYCINNWNGRIRANK